MTRSMPRVRKSLVVGILAPVFVLVAMVSWALASPVGASPDDHFHLASIWCGDGLQEDVCEPGPTAEQRELPKELGDATCFAFKSEQSAACQGPEFTSDSNKTIVTDRGNWSGDYPPVFYAVMGLFAGENVSLSVLLMRVFNAVLFTGLITALYRLLPAHRRPTMVWSLAISLVPLGLFLIPSTNPSGWAVMSAGILWVSLLGFFESTGFKRVGLGVLAVLATVMGAGARADAAVYAVVAVAAVTVYSARRDRRFLLSLLLPLGLAVIAVLFYFSAAQSSFAASGLPSGAQEGGGLGWKALLYLNFLNVPSLWSGALGTWGLGWLDTTLPAVVWVTAVAVFAAMTFTGLRSLDWRKALAIAGVLGAVWLFPTYVLVQSNVLVGSEVQPRYILPLLIILGGVALLQRGRAGVLLGRGQAVVIAVALAVAQSVALHFNLRRYVTGSDVVDWNLDDRIEWWWGLPISPMGVWFLGTVAFAAVLVIAVSLLRPARERELVAEPAPSAAPVPAPAPALGSAPQPQGSAG